MVMQRFPLPSEAGAVRLRVSPISWLLSSGASRIQRTLWAADL